MPRAVHTLLPSAYRPLLTNRDHRRILAGFAVSYLGDGMGWLAVAWLAIKLASPATAGVWVGAAVAAYALPGALGALVFGRRVRRLQAKHMILADAVLRAVFIGAIPCAWLGGVLSLPLYVGLLAVSSLLHAWGHAGTYTVLADVLPAEQRLSANTLISTLDFAATIIGPAIAGGLVTILSPALVLGIDALTFIVLAAVVGTTRVAKSAPTAPLDPEAARAGIGFLREHPDLLGVLVLTWFFNLLYGPVEVALPVHVAKDLHAPGSILGLYWSLFGAAAVIGGLVVGTRRGLRPWAVLIAIVLGWGLCLVPFGWGVPTAVTIVCFTLGGAIYGPYVAVSMTLLQDRTRAEQRAAFLALRAAVLLTASPLGTAIGGPITTALGPRTTLAGSGLVTVLLGTVAALVLVARRRPAPPAYTSSSP